MKKWFLWIFWLVLPAVVWSEGEVSILTNGSFDGLKGWVPRNAAANGTGRVITSKKDNQHRNYYMAQCKVPAAQPWMMELRQPITVPVGRGTVVLISFEYRITPGYSFNFYWQEERSPWPKLVSLHIDSPVDTWQTVSMTVPVHEDFQPETTALSFHLAEKVGTVMLRSVQAVMYPAGTNPDSIASNTRPVLGGDFYDKDWRSHAEKKLQEVRMLPVNIHVERKNGMPVAEADVSLEQVSRPFRFGVETRLPLFLPEALRHEAAADLRSQLENSSTLLPDYRSFLTDKSLFQFLTFSDAFLWRNFDLWGANFDKHAVADAIGAGLQVRGHALYIPAFMYAPVACRKMDRAALAAAIHDHIASLAARHGDRIAEWNVIHGGPQYQEIYNFLGINNMLDACKTAREAAPNSKHFLSDPEALSAVSEVPMRDCIELGRWLTQTGVKLDGIVLDANMKRLEVAPQSMEQRLDEISNALQLPIHIAHFGVGDDSDASQSRELADYLTLFFSHGAVHSVSFAEPWSKGLVNPSMALLKDDLSPRPAANQVRTLLTETWKTSFHGKANENGDLLLDVFKGDYRIVVTGKKSRVAANFQLMGDKNEANGPVTVKVTRKGTVITVRMKE